MHRRSGFTLIELLVVIAIIGILATLVITSVRGAQTRAKNSRAKSDISQMAKGVDLYRNEDKANPGQTVVHIQTSASSGYANPSFTPPSYASGGPAAKFRTYSIMRGKIDPPIGSPTIPTIFTGSQTINLADGLGRYGTGITSTPSNDHIYIYGSGSSVNGVFSATSNPSTVYILWTTIYSAGSVSDTPFCIKNGTAFNGLSNQPLAPPSGCALP